MRVHERLDLTVWTKVPRRNKKARFAITAVLNWFLTSVMFLPMTAVSTYLSLLELPGTRLIWSKNVALYYLDTSKHHDTEKRFSAVLHVKQSRKLKCRWHCIKRLCALVMITLGTQPCPLWAICESHTGKVKPLDGVRSLLLHDNITPNSPWLHRQYFSGSSINEQKREVSHSSSALNPLKGKSNCKSTFLSLPPLS